MKSLVYCFFQHFVGVLGCYIGIFGFSDFGEVSDTNTFSEQKHQYGLLFESEFNFNDISDLIPDRWIVEQFDDLGN